MPRSKKWSIRNALHVAESAIPKKRTKSNERERDLIATANCAIWDEDMRRLLSCLRRLKDSPERGETYEKILGMCFA